jgi:argininosuccinate lyase
MALWGARFGEEADCRLNDFNSSIGVDKVMYAQDIKGSIAHVTMLSKQGIIPKEDGELISKTLEEIKADIESGVLSINPKAEDIHMFLEEELTVRCQKKGKGDAGKRLHTARSRNDQVALDVRLYSMEQCHRLLELIGEFITVLCDKAGEHTETIMPGYTHLQRAQPITFAHHLMAYTEMLLRDMERLLDAKGRCNVLPLGSGALATTTYPIDREYVAELLGFDSVCQNSLDGVSDRDFAIEMAADLSILMMHLSRFSEEIILWSSWEFKYIELADAFATGSSIMPQKKNPDVCELVRGKSGRVFGNLQSLLTMMKGLPLAYNKDMQEDKEALFDCFTTVEVCLTTLIPMVATCTVKKDTMRQAAAKGFINATDCADYLTKKGLPFREAYGVVGRLVHGSIEKGMVLETLTLEDYKAASPLFEEDIYEAISLETCVKNRKVTGGPAPETVKQEIESVEKRCRELLLKVSQQ